VGESETLFLLGDFAGGFVCGILVAMLIVLAVVTSYRHLGPEDLE
jgi:hypothetical protein